MIKRYFVTADQDPRKGCNEWQDVNGRWVEFKDHDAELKAKQIEIDILRNFLTAELKRSYYEHHAKELIEGINQEIREALNDKVK